MRSRANHVRSIKHHRPQGDPAMISLRSDMFPHGCAGGLITVSGLDGSGKSTLVHAITEHLMRAGVPTHAMKVPSQACKAIPAFQQYLRDHTAPSRGEVDLLGICLLADADVLMS